VKTKPPAHPSGIAAWLTASELLAIVLRTGLEGKNAVELGREILLHFGSVPAMMTAWRDIKGLSAVIADSENERKFIRSVQETTNLAHYDGWIKSTRTRLAAGID
jgi:DNA repair protein RadC